MIVWGLSIEVYFIVALLSLPAFFLWRKLLKKSAKSLSNKARLFISCFAAFVSAALVYVGIVSICILSIEYYPHHDFNRDKWISEKEQRYEVSHHLIASKILIGKTKDEIRQILGDEGNSDQSEHWSYYLGFRPGLFNMSPDTLDIEFQAGKVMKVGQHPK